MRNPPDLNAGLIGLCAALVVVLIVGLWIEAWLDKRRARRATERNRALRQDYGYLELWEQAEDRFWSKLRHSNRQLVAADFERHAEELAAIRAQRFGTEAMDMQAARKEIKAKIFH